MIAEEYPIETEYKWEKLAPFSYRQMIRRVVAS